jgi:uncharacterized membrane protein
MSIGSRVPRGKALSKTLGTVWYVSAGNSNLPSLVADSVGIGSYLVLLLLSCFTILNAIQGGNPP